MPMYMYKNLYQETQRPSPWPSVTILLRLVMAYRLGRKKNCQITVDLDFPPGGNTHLWALIIGALLTSTEEYRLNKEFPITFKVKDTGRSKSRLNGPFDDDWQFHDDVALNAYVWSPCGEKRALILIATLRWKRTRKKPLCWRHHWHWLHWWSDQSSLGIKWRRCR